jgi:hypothetical protein
MNQIQKLGTDIEGGEKFSKELLGYTEAAPGTDLRN